MKTFSSFILKEIKHILRDRRTMLILFGMPLVMMLLFGFAISTDVKDVRIAVVTTSSDQLTRHIVERLNASEYFQLTHHVTTTAEAERLICNQQADIAVVFSPDFAAHRYDGRAQIQLILDGADPNMATQQGAYASQIITSEVANAVVKPHVEVVTKLLYNPQMKSAYNFVPGIMGMLLLLICAMMTSVSIVREKERGTMEVLLVSPVRPLMILIAKVTPYFVLSVMILFLILGISNYVLEVPVSGNLLSILCLCLLYIFLALALGLLISVVANTQLEALLISGMLMLLPSMLLSGMIYPIESMPQILQWVSAVIPARWFISAIRKLMIMGVGMNRILPELIILVGMGLLILIVALKKFKQRLE
ncbi:ABC transporter permease [Hoylesella saccharolytica]|uniref:ABC transporter permease n=1 Tax=Hoylesella saccharolytica TaxID=633701 RepID=UPI0028E812B4|nr:ABC transporter permease [Hoylesella saccharolytica]